MLVPADRGTPRWNGHLNLCSEPVTAWLKFVPAAERLCMTQSPLGRRHSGDTQGHCSWPHAQSTARELSLVTHRPARVEAAQGSRWGDVNGGRGSGVTDGEGAVTQTTTRGQYTLAAVLRAPQGNRASRAIHIKGITMDRGALGGGCSTLDPVHHQTLRPRPGARDPSVSLHPWMGHKRLQGIPAGTTLPKRSPLP